MPIIERDEHGRLVKTCNKAGERISNLKNRGENIQQKPGRAGKFTTRNMKFNRKQKDEHKCSKVYTTWKPSKGCT